MFYINFQKLCNQLTLHALSKRFIIMVSMRSRIANPIPIKKCKVDEAELHFKANCEYFKFLLLMCCENWENWKEQEMKITKRM